MIQPSPNLIFPINHSITHVILIFYPPSPPKIDYYPCIIESHRYLCIIIMLRFSSLHRLYQINNLKKTSADIWQDYATEGYKDDYRKVLPEIEKEAVVDYKVYPYLPHQDPKNKSYVSSELDEYHDKTKVEAYNKIVSQFQHDMALQKQVWAAIDSLERTYKSGKKGVTTNLNDKVAGPKLQDLGFERQSFNDFNLGFKNEDAFVANTPWVSKYKPDYLKEWEVEYLNRPVHKHFHPDKGYKYDVPVKPEEKYEFLADRLGHPEFFGTPLQRLLKLQKEIYHPNFIDQPFVQTPSNKPHESLNFEEGEVIYENAKLKEWLNFWKFLIVFVVAFSGWWINYQFMYKTKLTEELYGKRKMFWMKSPKSDRKKRENARKNLFRLDRFRVLILVATLGVPAITFAIIRMITLASKPYIVKMSYSLDKELVFLKRVGTFGRLQEEVVEVAHLEVPPSCSIARMSDISSQDPNGVWHLTNLASVNYLDSIFLYNNDRYWNPKLKDEFLRGRLGLWDKGVYGYNRQESKDILAEIEKEVNEAYNQKALPAN